MPLYEFECRDCGTVFEELIRNTADEAAAVCPICGTTDIQRLLSATSSPSGAGASMGSAGGCGGGHSGFT